MNPLCKIQPVTRIVDGCIKVSAQPKPLPGNTSHNIQKVSKDLGLFGVLLLAGSGLDKKLKGV